MCKDVTLRTALLYRSLACAVQCAGPQLHTQCTKWSKCGAGVVEQLYQHADERGLCQQERRLALRYLRNGRSMA